VIIPELAVLDEAHLDQLRAYVRSGGRLIAFGHASLLDARSQRRGDYGLSDVYGVSLTGEVTFPANAQKATIKVDSEYSEAFGARVLAGAPGEAWASDGSPMPHWIELTLPKRIDVARVELVNRSGPYQITDVEIETFEGDTWKPINSVQGASTSKIVVPLSPPVKTEKLRIKILKELYHGKDRQYADVRAVRVWDTTGRDWVDGWATPISLTANDLEIARAFDDPAITWAPMAVSVDPTAAEVVGYFKGSSAAAIFKNRFGQGQATLITTSDGAFRVDHSFWNGFAKLIPGEPTLMVNAKDHDRYRFIMTRIPNACVLHVIDAQTDLPGKPTRQVSVSLLSASMGDPAYATLIGANEPLTFSQDGGRIEFVVRPDPASTVVLK
jgi:hypothetical protein